MQRLCEWRATQSLQVSLCLKSKTISLSAWCCKFVRAWPGPSCQPAAAAATLQIDVLTTGSLPWNNLFLSLHSFTLFYPRASRSASKRAPPGRPLGPTDTTRASFGIVSRPPARPLSCHRRRVHDCPGARVLPNPGGSNQPTNDLFVLPFFLFNSCGLFFLFSRLSFPSARHHINPKCLGPGLHDQPELQSSQRRTRLNPPPVTAAA